MRRASRSRRAARGRSAFIRWRTASSSASCATHSRADTLPPRLAVRARDLPQPQTAHRRQSAAAERPPKSQRIRARAARSCALPSDCATRTMTRFNFVLLASAGAVRARARDRPSTTRASFTSSCRKSRSSRSSSRSSGDSFSSSRARGRCMRASRRSPRAAEHAHARRRRASRCVGPTRRRET